MNIAQLFDRSAHHFADSAAIVADGRTISYGELRTQVDRVARELVERGIRRGDRVGLFLPNIPEFAVAYFATQ